MNTMIRTLMLSLGSALALCSSYAQAVGQLLDVNVYDRQSGRQIPVYYHQGQYYVAGQPGKRYQIALNNRQGRRLLAVVSVDGVNVITGETAAANQSGYVLDAYGKTDISGWRKSMDEVASFVFTREERSYAARTGRPFDVGVIGVAVFEERPAPIIEREYSDRDRRGRMDEAPLAKSAPGRRSAAAAASGSAPAAAPMMEQEEKIGTGHGRREWSEARYTDFERASREPSEIIAIYYDSYANLVNQGVIPRSRYYRPQPFPNRFVPDPR